MKTDIHSFVLDTETFLCNTGSRDFDLRSLITKPIDITFGHCESVGKGFTQQNIYSIHKFQLIG